MDMASWVWLTFIAVVPLAAWPLRRWIRKFDDYYEQEYQDPPIGAPRFPGGGPGI